MGGQWVGPESENPSGLRLAWPFPPPRLLRWIIQPALLGAMSEGQTDQRGDLGATFSMQKWKVRLGGFPSMPSDSPGKQHLDLRLF